MGNRISERMRRTDQSYPQPEYPGASSQQDGNRNPRPEYPGASSQQDGNRNLRPEYPGASSQQDGNRNPRPEYPGASSQQDGNRNPRPEYPDTSSQQDGNRNEDGMVPTLGGSISVPPQDVLPTLRDLSLLPVPNWYLLGLQLGISGDELDVIERNYPRDNHMCKVKMFGTWLRMDTSATYERLARALVAVGKRKIAEAMCTARGIPLTVLADIPVTAVEPLPPTPTVLQDSPECLTRFADYLKDKYKRMSTLPDGDWPPSLGRQYTRLAMIEQERELPGAELVATMERDYIHGNIDNIVKRKKAIQLPEVFLPTEDSGQQLKILMDGAPGVGKSTLSRKICKDWASGELLHQYHLVLLLPLRQARIREATTVEGLIEADDPDLKCEVVRHIQRTSGEHVLLIVDGYDELSYKDRTQDSFFLDIVKGNKFPKCSVLVTSRPYASDYLQQLQSINRHVEVLGFTKQQIEHCIIENILDKVKATELVQALKERQDITSLCYIPLNCAIVLYVYEKEQCALPHSLTRLYETFIVNAVKRHAKIIGNDPRNIRRFHTFANMSDPLRKQLSALTKLAYDGLVADKMVFSVDDLEAAFPDCSEHDVECNLLGLMTVFKEFASTGEELSFQFLHLTIQEFLAARWAVSQLSADELLKLFQDHLREERYRMMLLFLAGTSQLNFPSVEDLFLNECDLVLHRNTEIKHFLFLAHLIYESHNFCLFCNLARTLRGRTLSTAWYTMSPFDCLVLAHFLVFCNCSLLSLDLRGCDLTSQSLEILHRVNLKHSGHTRIRIVDLSHNPKVITKLSLLPKLPMFEHTTELIAQGLRFPERVSCVVDLHFLLNLRHLTYLDILVKEIHDSSHLEYSLSLNKFQFRDGNIDSQNAVDIFRLLEHITSLKELDLSGNSQLAKDDSEAVGCAIERMLRVNKTLKVLNLGGCGITDPMAKHILAGLSKNTSLVTLHMGSSQLSVSCALLLIQQMTTHPIRSILGEMNILGIGKVKIDRETTCTMRLWYVVGVTTPEGCMEFFRGVNNLGLKVSKLNVHSLTDQTAKHLAVGLAENNSIQALDITKHCDISSVGAVSILKSIEHNTSVEELDLSENSQLAEADSEVVGYEIESMLNVNRTLKVLNLSGCNVTDPIVKHILTGLTNNSSLVTLDIGSPKLSGSCAVSLLQQVTTLPTLSRVHVGEVNVVGVGRLKLDRGALWCVIGDTVPEACVEFFRALNNSSMKASKLNIHDITDQTAEHFSNGLAESQSVQALKLKHCNISSAGAMSIFRSLEHNTSLEELDLSGNQQLLAQGDSEGVGCAIGKTLNVNRTLKVLNLSGCGLGSAVASSSFRSLEHNTSLEELDLSWNSQLAVGNSEAVGCAIERMLNVNRTLRVLNLYGCGLDTAVTTHIAAGLAHNASLTELFMGWNYPVTSEGWVCVFSTFYTTSLKKLDISWNKLEMEGSVPLAKMLSCDISLTEVSLACCHIPEAGLREIARGLLHNTSLKKLDVSKNKLGMEGSLVLATMLSCNNSLTELCLQDCLIPDAGVRKIARGLLQNKCLKKFDISDNKLGMEGSVALGKMLSRNKSLNELSLEWCQIPVAGFCAIVKGLLYNTSLKKLDMSHNNLVMDGSLALGKMLSRNKSLTELSLWECDISQGGLKEIARGLLKSASLQTLVIEYTKKTFLEEEIKKPKRSRIFTGKNMRILEIKSYI